MFLLGFLEVSRTSVGDIVVREPTIIGSTTVSTGGDAIAASIAATYFVPATILARVLVTILRLPVAENCLHRKGNLMPKWNIS